jgi:hypothetical protein
MATEVFVAKYVPDPARGEPRNVGVVVRDGERALARFIGETTKPGVAAIDGRSVRYAVGAPLEAYREWVRFWRRELLERGGHPEELPAAPGSAFFLVRAGEIWLDESHASLESNVARLYSRLVQADASNEEELEQRVERLLTDAEVATRPSFRRDVPVKSTGLRREETYRFAYGYQNGHLVVGHRVPLALEAYVHDALWRYRNIDPAIEKVSFIQAGDQHSDLPALGLLRDVSTVIDVTSSDAEARTMMAFLGTS